MDEECAPDSTPEPRLTRRAAKSGTSLPQRLVKLSALDDLHLQTKAYVVAATPVIEALATAGPPPAAAALRKQVEVDDVPSAWAAAHAVLLGNSNPDTALLVLTTLERERTLVDDGVVGGKNGAPLLRRLPAPLSRALRRRCTPPIR